MKAIFVQLAVLFLTVAAALTLTGCGQIISSVREEVRQGERRSRPPRVPAPDVEDVAVGSEPLRWTGKETETFFNNVEELLRKRDFAGLEAQALNLRQSKARFEKGGGWKIHSFYGQTNSPTVQTEDAWKERIALLEAWKNAMPKSIAARASLAELYLNYAWEARGSGFASEIPVDAEPVFESRMKKAGAEILEASKLEERCYGYFETLLKIARASGMNRDDFEKSFQEAIAFDKTYSYFYVLKAENLLPRWHGEPGELEEFAEGLTTSLGENEGLKTYYLIVTAFLAYKWEGPYFKPDGFSWKRTKKGFSLYDKDHGMTRLKLNQFARMAFMGARDAQAGCNTFKRLQGENDFEPEVWKTRQEFDGIKSMALTVMCKVAESNNQAK